MAGAMTSAHVGRSVLVLINRDKAQASDALGTVERLLTDEGATIGAVFDDRLAVGALAEAQD